MTEALDKLITAVESGDLTVDGAPALSMKMSAIVYAALGDDLWADCVDAFDGSLDSAVAIKDALLPGWEWGRLVSHGTMVVATREGPYQSFSDGSANPARALLLATLRAVKWERDGTFNRPA